MKNLFIILTSFLFLLSFNQCSSDNEENTTEPEIISPIDLVLSVKGLVTIDKEEDIDMVVDILEGNGDYKIHISDEECANAKIIDNKLFISFILNGYVTMTIEDKEGQKDEIRAIIHIPSLISYHCTTFLNINNIYEDDLSNIEYRAGDFTIENITGKSVEVSIENDILSIKGIAYGKTEFELTDKRGAKIPYTVHVCSVDELMSEQLDLEAVPEQIMHVNLWSENWTIDYYNTKCFNVYMHNQAEGGINNQLQIDVLPNWLGSSYVGIKNENGDSAIINITVKS